MLFLKLLDEHQPFSLRVNQLEDLFAEGTLYDIPWPFVVIERNGCIANRTIHFDCHVAPPVLLVLTLDIIK